MRLLIFTFVLLTCRLLSIAQESDIDIHPNSVHINTSFLGTSFGNFEVEHMDPFEDVEQIRRSRSHALYYQRSIGRHWGLMLGYQHISTFMTTPGHLLEDINSTAARYESFSLAGKGFNSRSHGITLDAFYRFHLFPNLNLTSYLGVAMNRISCDYDIQSLYLTIIGSGPDTIGRASGGYIMSTKAYWDAQVSGRLDLDYSIRSALSLGLSYQYMTPIHSGVDLEAEDPNFYQNFDPYISPKTPDLVKDFMEEGLLHSVQIRHSIWSISLKYHF